MNLACNELGGYGMGLMRKGHHYISAQYQLLAHNWRTGNEQNVNRKVFILDKIREIWSTF